MTKLEHAAVEWWQSKRPAGWTDEEHLANPEINTVTKTEAVLAREVAELMRKG